MLSSLRKCHLIPGGERVGIVAIAASALALSGCSADVSRFDLGYSDSARSQNYASSGNTGSGTTGRMASAEYGSAGYDRPSYRGSDVSRSELPPTPQEPMTTAAIQDRGYNNGGYSGGYGSQQGYGTTSSSGDLYRGGQGYDAQQQRAPQSGSYGGSYGAQSSQPAYSGSPNSQYGSSGASQGTYGSTAGNGRYGATSPAAPTASHSAAASGETIEVRQGDTLYSLARQHNVNVNELKSANGLASNDLRPGQQLHLPSANARTRTATETARPPREAYDTASAPASHAAADAPSDWNRNYTVRQGDSLYGIARQNSVKLADVQRYNGIADARQVKPGSVIKLPGEHSAAASDSASVPPLAEASRHESSPPPAAQSTPSPAPGVVRLGEAPPPASTSPQAPTLLNGAPPPAQPERVAKADTNTATDAVSPSNSQNSTAVAGFSKLRWPVSGKVIANFGPRPDGTHNDGVNLAVPLGTDVHAAESGVVAYAGDELKGYGNLVLVRHDNGWVTAYAHADEIMVKRGDQIKRGQVIAKAGRTGQVDQPQVHFELRQGQKPVDPTPFMERL